MNRVAIGSDLAHVLAGWQGGCLGGNCGYGVLRYQGLDANVGTGEGLEKDQVSFESMYYCSSLECRHIRSEAYYNLLLFAWISHIVLVSLRPGCIRERMKYGMLCPGLGMLERGRNSASVVRSGGLAARLKGNGSGAESVLCEKSVLDHDDCIVISTV